jgi:hypothetical protein
MTKQKNIVGIKAKFHDDTEDYEMYFCVDQEDLANILDYQNNDNYFFDACSDRIRNKGILGDLFLDHVEVA